MQNTLASLGLFPCFQYACFYKTFGKHITFFFHSLDIYQIIYNIQLTFSWPEEEQQASALGE